MATISLPNTFTAGTTIASSQVNSNFTTIANDYNGNITNANVAAGAAIAASKLSLATVAQTVAMSGAAMNWADAANLASATTTNIGAAAGNKVNITGVTTITAFDTIQAGTVRFVRFTGILVLTHNGTTLILPTAANITTAVGDCAIFVSEGAGNWRCWNYSLASGSPLVAFTAATAPTGTVLQVVNTIVSTVNAGTTVMPKDDTIPQSNEGDQVMTLAITPNATTNKLKIDVVFIGVTSAAGNDFGVALFQDATANALAAAPGCGAAAASPVTVAFTWYMTAGTTSATTFKVRAGIENGAGTLTFNGFASGRMYGGVAASSITISEIKV